MYAHVLFYVTDNTGNVITSNLKVELLKTGTSTLAQLYDTSSGNNPATEKYPDANGLFSFFVDPGTYDFKIYDTSTTPATLIITIPEVRVGHDGFWTKEYGQTKTYRIPIVVGAGSDNVDKLALTEQLRCVINDTDGSLVRLEVGGSPTQYSTWCKGYVNGNVLVDGDIMRTKCSFVDVYRSSQYTFPSSGWQTIPYDSEAKDNLNEYDPTTYAITINQDGIYYFSVGVTFSAEVQSVIASIYNSTTLSHTYVARADSGSVKALHGSTVLSLSSGDIIYIQLYMANAVTIVGTKALTYMRMVRIG